MNDEDFVIPCSAGTIGPPNTFLPPCYTLFCWDHRASQHLPPFKRNVMLYHLSPGGLSQRPLVYVITELSFPPALYHGSPAPCPCPSYPCPLSVPPPISSSHTFGTLHIRLPPVSSSLVSSTQPTPAPACHTTRVKVSCPLRQHHSPSTIADGVV